MAGYHTEAEAAVDGYAIVHHPDRHQFVVKHHEKVVGHANYALGGNNTIDFNGTFMSPDHRSTGLSALLVARALADPVVKDRQVLASCWYVAKYIDEHPDSLAAGATYAG